MPQLSLPRVHAYAHPRHPCIAEDADEQQQCVADAQCRLEWRQRLAQVLCASVVTKCAHMTHHSHVCLGHINENTTRIAHRARGHYLPESELNHKTVLVRVQVTKSVCDTRDGVYL
jgi:hypothetical protein